MALRVYNADATSVLSGDAGSTMSRMSWPNRITIGRILLIAPFVICLLYVPVVPSARLAAVGIFVAMAVSDFLDGYLARRLGAETPLGRFLDPLADKLLIICSMVLLARSAGASLGMRLPAWVAVAAVGKDVLVVLGFTLIYLETDRVFIHARWVGKLCTTCQLTLVIGVLLSPDLRRLAAGPTDMTLTLLAWSATGLATATILDYARLGIQFVHDATPREPNDAHK